MYVLTDNAKRIVAIGNNYTSENDAIFINGAGYALFGQQIYEVATIPDGVKADYYTYDGQIFTELPGPENERLSSMETQITDLQMALVELYEGGGL